MTALLYLIPVALFLGLCGLAAFLWSLKSGQYDDLEGAAQRILFDDEPPAETRSEDGDAAAAAGHNAPPSEGATDTRKRG